MRLGYLIPEFPTQTHAFFWREQSALRELGVNITLISTRRPDRDLCQHDFAQEAHQQTIYCVPIPPVSSFGRLLLHPIRTMRALGYVAALRESSLKERLKALAYIPVAAHLVSIARAHQLDHIHVHSCANAAHVAAIARLLGSPPYSLTLHGDLPVYGRDHQSKMTRASIVTAVTRPLARSIVEQVGLPESRVPVIWMGVDPDIFTPVEHHDAAPGKLNIITVARLNHAKGHVHLLAAIAQLVSEGLDLHYTIVGQGKNQSAIEERIAELNLVDRVKLTGTLSESQVRDQVAQHDVFALPSIGLGEAAPVSVMEAMATGLPVVCSIIGGTPDMITHDVDGILCDQGAEDQLAAALRRLAQSPDLRRRIGKAARERAVRQFDYRKMAGELLREIEKSAPPDEA